MRLAEIGREGQAKIESAEVVIARGFAGHVERRYLEGAGIGKVTEGDVEATDTRFDGLDPAARDVAVGAHAAVVAIKRILGA